MGRVGGWVPGHRSKKPYYATAQRGPSLTIILCVLRSEARFLIFMVNHLEVINDTPDIFKQT